MRSMLAIIVPVRLTSCQQNGLLTPGLHQLPTIEIQQINGNFSPITKRKHNSIGLELKMEIWIITAGIDQAWLFERNCFQVRTIWTRIAQLGKASRFVAVTYRACPVEVTPVRLQVCVVRLSSHAGLGAEALDGPAAPMCIALAITADWAENFYQVICQITSVFSEDVVTVKPPL